jgi:D-inositol-3-phosphate glycosyltransferase
VPTDSLTIAMLSIHSDPLGPLGTRDTGGMSVYVRELAREMGRRGHRVDIFTRRWRDTDPEMVRLAPQVHLVSLDITPFGPLSKTTLFAYADQFMTAIDAFRCRQDRSYDIIHSHYWLSGHVGQMARRRWQRPHVITFHTLGALKADTPMGANEPIRRLAVEKELVQVCDGLLAPCEREKSNLMHCFNADPAKIMMVPGGVDLERFGPTDQAVARRQLGFNTTAFMLLSVGRLSPLKGQDRIIEALALLGNDTRAELVIVGGDGSQDPERRRLEDLAAQTGVQARVRWAGSIANRDLPPYYAAADVYVLASHYESFGLVGLEAMACGRPVVSTPVGIMAALARMQRAGVIITDGQPEAMAAAIASVRETASQWPPDVIREAVGDLSWAKATSAALDAYRAVMQDHTATVS